MPLPPLKNPKTFTQRLKGNLQGTVTLTYLFSICLFINFLQCLSMLIRPFSKKAFRAVNRRLAGFWWGQCVHLANICGIEANITGDTLPKAENTVMICNHQDMADITFIFFLAKKLERIGDMKWYVKDVLKWIPGIGWGMAFIDCIFVKRDWHKDKASINATFKSLTQDKVPAMVISFTEGTRVRPKKLKESQEFAEKNGIKPLNHVLIPRAKGFVATVTGMRSYLDAVYDLTIGYEKGVPSLWQYAKGYARRAHLHVRRYPIKDIPTEEEALKSWLMARFEEKDELLDSFYRNGSFTE